MAFVLRMKNVSRFLLFAGSLTMWVVVLTILNDTVFNADERLVVVGGSLMLGFLQTWLLTLALHT